MDCVSSNVLDYKDMWTIATTNKNMLIITLIPLNILQWTYQESEYVPLSSYLV